MKSMGTIEYAKMSNRGQAAVDVTALYYRAAMAEALLKGEPPEPMTPPEGAPPREGEPPNAVGAFVKATEKLNRRQRRRLVKMLMTEDLGVHKMSARDRAIMEKWVQPTDKTAFYKRVSLSREYQFIFEDTLPNDPDDTRVDWPFVKWTGDRIRDFLPDMVLRDDGRPDDAEPDTPEPDEPTPTPPPPASPVTPVGQRLNFNVETIICDSETHGERGDDEINYSGVAAEGPVAAYVNPNAVGAVLLDQRDAGSFSPGTVRDESGLPPLHSYDLSGVTLPHLFVMHLLMAEIDNQGPFGMADNFRQFRQSFYFDILYEVQTNWAFWIFNITAFTIAGAALGWIYSGLLAAVIGGIVGGILGAVWSYLFDGNGDDMFDPEMTWVLLEAPALDSDPFNGNPRSPTMRQEMKGDGGVYQLDYHWELVGFVPPAPGDSDADAPLE